MRLFAIELLVERTAAMEDAVDDVHGNAPSRQSRNFRLDRIAWTRDHGCFTVGLADGVIERGSFATYIAFAGYMLEFAVGNQCRQALQQICRSPLTTARRRRRERVQKTARNESGNYGRIASEIRRDPGGRRSASRHGAPKLSKRKVMRLRRSRRVTARIRRATGTGRKRALPAIFDRGPSSSSCAASGCAAI